MNKIRWLTVTGIVCLSVTATVAQAAIPQGSLQKTHLKYSQRPALNEPVLRSSAALVLDTSNSSVLYSRRAAIAMPIASITKLMTALVVMDAGQPLDETLTVMRLALSKSLQRTFATTNPIENMNGSLRRIARNVKRWRDESMIRRWVALGIAEAQRGFRRVRGYKDMASLIAVIRTTMPVATEKQVA